MRLLFIDPRMPIQCIFHSVVQCQTSRDIYFEKKGVCQNITRTSSYIYIYIYIPFQLIIGDINITKVKRNQEIEATFILGPLLFQWMVVFKSLL